MTFRKLTESEITLAHTVFGEAIDYAPVTVRRSKWFPFQPRETIMAPCGHIHLHPQSSLWSEDYGQERLTLQALFLHELTHVWQAQQRGKYYLPLMRHPFCRYHYSIRAGWRFERYGLEQQAELVRHTFLLRHGHQPRGAPPLETLESIVPFEPSAA
jgi:hypothetical protein